jgi:RHS repeat-associated protein
MARSYAGVAANQAGQDYVAAVSTVGIGYIQVDHLNTPRAVTDASGMLMWRWDNTEPFSDSVANGDPNTTGAVFDMPLGFPGQYRDRETGTLYNYFRNYDSTTARYQEADPIGLRGGLNRYAYALNRPTSLIDPSGLACTAAGGRVTCTVPGGGPTVTFPRPGGWPDVINDDSSFHHFYNVTVDMQGANIDCVMRELANMPTPGNPSPATAGGTLNNALPTTAQGVYDLVDQVSSFGNDPGGYNNAPVMSYTIGNSVVNVTQPGHPLHPGYVVRQPNGNVVNNYGEGTAGVQSSYSPIADLISGVWGDVTTQAINKCKCGTR